MFSTAGTLAAAPLASIGQHDKSWNVADSAKNWFADKLASNLVKSHVNGSRNSLSSSSEESDREEEKAEAQMSDSSRRASVRVSHILVKDRLNFAIGGEKNCPLVDLETKIVSMTNEMILSQALIIDANFELAEDQ